jgi:hypothetical protein
MRALHVGTASAGLAISLLLQSCSRNDAPPVAETNSSIPIANAASPPQPIPTPPSIRAPRVIIDSPAGGSVGLTATFRWHIEDVEAGDVYRYKILLDKGQDACDGGIEEEFDAKTETCLRVKLSPTRYANASADFAIRATNTQGRTYCTQGGRIRVSPKLPPSPSCKGRT